MAYAIVPERHYTTEYQSLESISLHSLHSRPQVESDHAPLLDNGPSSAPSEPIRRPMRIKFRLQSPMTYLEKRPSSWRAGAVLNICIAVVILICNVSIPVWAAQKYGASEGLLYKGPCETTEKLAVFSHVSINIFGAILLAATNYTMQILASPTREDIDAAHSRSISLTIGASSIKNLRFLGYTRVILWVCLVVSSLPLHLLYNSVVVSTTGETAQLVTVVTSNFQNGSSFDLEHVNKFRANTSTIDHPFRNGWLDYPDGKFDPKEDIAYHPPTIADGDRAVLIALQEKASKMELVELTAEDCILTYLKKPQTKYRNVLAVSNSTRSNNSVLWLDRSYPTDENSTNWICIYGWVLSGFHSIDDSTHVRCNRRTISSNSSLWSLGFSPIKIHQEWKVGSFPTDKCLVELLDQPCSLRYERSILVIVLITTTIKLLAMIATLLQYRCPAMVTIGDALASFLQSPDHTTRGMCIARKEDFTHAVWEAKQNQYMIRIGDSRRSFAASGGWWGATFALLASTFILATIFFAVIYDKSTGPQWFFRDSAQFDKVKIGRDLSDTALVCLANLPQLVLSLNYMLLNHLMTCIAGSREWSLFAYQRKGLRTSNPKGAQRSTYWLQLPLKFSLPMMALSALIHYVTSQSISFSSQKILGYWDSDGEIAVLNHGSGLQYSQTATHVLLILLVLSLALVIVWGQQYNKLGIPPCGFNSAAISAACHPPVEEEEPHLKPVQWGAIPSDGDQSEVGHCSFSSGEVTMPIEGRMYM